MDIPDIGPDEVVRVLDDAEKVMSLQLSAGIEWREDTCDVRSTDLKQTLVVTLYMHQY